MNKFATFMMLVIAFIAFVLSGVAAAGAVNPWTPAQDPGACAGTAVGCFGTGLCFLAIYITDTLKK
jgi:hypothetical protein